HPDDGQNKVLAVGFADRKRVAKMDAKRLGRSLVEDRDGTIIGAEKAAATNRESTRLGFFLRLDAENIEVEKTCARHDVAEQALSGDNGAACNAELVGIDQRLIDRQSQRRQLAAARGLEHGTIE